MRKRPLLHPRENQRDPHFDGELQQRAAQTLSTLLIAGGLVVSGGFGFCVACRFAAASARGLGNRWHHGNDRQRLEPLHRQTHHLTEQPVVGFLLGRSDKLGAALLGFAKGLSYDLFCARRIIENLHRTAEQQLAPVLVFRRLGGGLCGRGASLGQPLAYAVDDLG